MKIQSYKGEYEVQFVDDFSIKLKEVLKIGDVLIIDKNVYDLYRKKLDSLTNNHSFHIISPSETEKSYHGVSLVIESLIVDGFRKNHRLIAIGGGITQDVTAFIASILYRGIAWIFVPTNLLSQCDSCIGSKTSINFKSFKNQIGGFYPPKLIINDYHFLQTLSKIDIRSGIGEMMHYFFISGRESFENIALQYVKAVSGDLFVLKDLISRSLAIKKAMIEIDEFDSGPRNIFNYGHSFGHAIESFTNYRLPHGIAISFGMDMANQVSAALGYITQGEADEMRVVLEKNWKPDILEVNDLEVYLSILRKDKKNIDQDIRLILTRGLGDMFITKVELNQQFIDTIAKCFQYYSAKKT